MIDLYATLNKADAGDIEAMKEAVDFFDAEDYMHDEDNDVRDRAYGYLLKLVSEGYANAYLYLAKYFCEDDREERFMLYHTALQLGAEEAEDIITSEYADLKEKFETF